MQISRVGESKGVNVVFKTKDIKKEFTVFTTRRDAPSGVTYCVIVSEHPYADKTTTKEQKEAIGAYKTACATRSDLERTKLNKEKTGISIGAYAISSVNGKEVPIRISDYVLANYGTRATVAVPAHDTRDWESAKRFGVDIIPALEGGDVAQKAYTEDDVHTNFGLSDSMGK